MAWLLIPALIGLAAPASAQAVSHPGQLYAFGDNRYGELGNATHNGAAFAPNYEAAPVTLPGAVGGVAAMASGSNYSLAVTASGQLYSFGQNTAGQLGGERGFKALPESINPLPALVTLPGEVGPVTRVAAGEAHSLVVTSSGQLYAFGDNLFGELGTASGAGLGAAEHFNPAPALVTLPGENGPVTEVAAGHHHSLVVTSSGQLYAFGENDYGQLGSTVNVESPSEANPTPSLVTLPGEVGPVTRVAAGQDFSLAVTSSGQLYGFGRNTTGQLGDTRGNEQLTANPTPALITLEGETGPVTDVAAGVDFSLAVTSTGQLYAFGDNFYGQLGRAEDNKTYKPHPKAKLVNLGLEKAVAVEASEAYSAVVTTAGNLYTFGENIWGQLGRSINSGHKEGEITQPNPEPLVTALPSLVDAVGRGWGSKHVLTALLSVGVATSSLPSGRAGTPYVAGAAAIGGVGPYAWSASGLPPGLSINPESGQVTGVPTSAGTYGVTLSVSDAFGATAASSALPLVVQAAGAGSTPGPEVTHASATAIRAGLLLQLVPHGRAARIGAILRARGYSYPFHALDGGALSIGWYLVPRGAHISARHPVLVASGTITFTQAGAGHLQVKLSPAGRRALAHARQVSLTAKGVFRSPYAGAVSALKSFRLSR